MIIKSIISRRYLINAILTASISVVGLSACTNTSVDKGQNYRIDRYSLIRSAAYTQRELLALELENTATVNAPRHQLLMRSYCDLIDRKAIYTAAQSSTCSDAKNNRARFVPSQCVVTFHRCIKTCDLRSNACRICESTATKCLDSNPSSSTLSEVL